VTARNHARLRHAAVFIDGRDEANLVALGLGNFGLNAPGSVCGEVKRLHE
jgi:hypothetical protein